MRKGILTYILAVAIAVSIVVLLPLPGIPHETGDEVFSQIGVTERVGGTIPQQLGFTDQAGREVRLSGFFTGGPVILTLNYYSCPTLCPLALRNLAAAVTGMKNLKPGHDFQMVTVSIDPQETAQKTAEKSSATYAMLGKTGEPGAAWHFLRGSGEAIATLAGRVGIRYARLDNGEFAHPNVIVIVTPDGRIARYLYGLEPDPQDLRLALIEASGGGIGGSRLLNKGLLYCFHYDPVGKKYVLLASRVMASAMLGTLLLTLGLLGVLWRKEPRATKQKGD